MRERTFSKYSIVRSKKVHRTLGIAEGKLLVVSSTKSCKSMFTVFGIEARLSKDNFEVVSRPFQVGDLAYCIDPTPTLTLGERYLTQRSQFSGEVSVTNDRGHKVEVLRSRFSLKDLT